MVNVFDAIAEGRYKNNVPYDREPDPVNEETMTVRQAREHKEKQKLLRNEQRELHHAEQHRLDALFKADLEAEHNVVGHPKADKLFSIAWQRGHAYGYYDVACIYDDIVELIKP